MNFKKVNNITGWAVFILSLLVFALSREARGSLWDCGEFVASAYKVQLPHPPGAPLFVLLGRFFIILFGNNGNTAASAVNFMSALASAATILFLFWTVTHFARKMFVKVGEDLTASQIVTTMIAGVLGAVAYAFSDSFWYSAVEGEVYALSSFFTALVVWAMLKWEHADEHAGNDLVARTRSDRWIIFLFFMVGLSIGVHLLNLLTIPAIVMIYYYRRYNVSLKGAIWAFIVGCIVTGVVQVVMIQYSMKAAGIFDVLFTNSFGMPFFTGFAIYFLLITALIAWMLTRKEGSLTTMKTSIWFVLFLALSTLPFFAGGSGGGSNFLKFIVVIAAAIIAGYFFKPTALRVLKLALWCYAFMLLGYFMYFSTLIRSNADPVIDMNNVDNPISLVYYLGREQYGSQPIVYGAHFAAEVTGYAKKDMQYAKGKNENGKDAYVSTGYSYEYEYDAADKMIFPRIWDASDDAFHASFYGQNLGLARDPQSGKWETPSYSQNLSFFFNYQMGTMYWRYFMWNFAGKQNDIQGLGNVRDGNWISGIPFLDNTRLGDQAQLPDSLKTNKANNKLFLLPFLLGIIGCVYQYLRNRKDFVVTFLLFFFTGIAVMIYLNPPGPQPRERDYAFVGSFYAYAIWIGLAAVAIVKLAREQADKLTFKNMLTHGAALTFFVGFLSCLPGSTSAIFVGALIITVLYAVLLLALTYATRAVGGAKDGIVGNALIGVVSLIVLFIMGSHEWNDHDRSKKTISPDLAKDYLESCAPNAILFTFGDNDTYPLWYAQEVEGVRPDIRIINNSLLGIDWYINQLRRKVNNSDPIDVIWTPEQIEGRKREYMRYNPDPSKDKNTYYPLYDFMKNDMGQTSIDPETGMDVGPRAFPISKVSVPVDVKALVANGTLLPTDSVVSPMLIDIPENTLRGIGRNDFIILNIIAANNWKRPIYFTSPYDNLGFGQYLRRDGLSYRLTPIRIKAPQQNWVVEQELRNNRIGGTGIRDNNSETIYKNLSEKFWFGGAQTPGVYFDEENRRHLLDMRQIFAEAAGNLADMGKKEEAQKLLDKVEKGLLTENMPYGYVARYNSHNQVGLQYLEACYKVGNKELAKKVSDNLKKDLDQQKKYYEYIDINKPEASNDLAIEKQINDGLLKIYAAVEAKYNTAAASTTVEGGSKEIHTNKDTVSKTGK